MNLCFQCDLLYIPAARADIKCVHACVHVLVHFLPASFNYCVSITAFMLGYKIGMFLGHIHVTIEALDVPESNAKSKKIFFSPLLNKKNISVLLLDDY